MHRDVVMVFLMSLLAGCGHLNSEFDCPKQAGVMCQSLDQINDLVDKGKLQGRTAVINGVQVQKEDLQQVWLAGVADDNGVYHKAHYVQLGSRI